MFLGGITVSPFLAFVETRRLFYPERSVEPEYSLVRPLLTAMATPGVSASHLTQAELSEHDKKILTEAGTLLSGTDDGRITEKLLGLFRVMDLAKKVRDVIPFGEFLLTTQFPNPVFRTMRVKTETRFLPTGEFPTMGLTSVTPIRILQGTPTISDAGKTLSLNIGWTTYITKAVIITPALDVLFITSKRPDAA